MCKSLKVYAADVSQGPAGHVSCMVSNFSATSCPNLPWTALAWEGQREGQWGWGWQSAGSRRGLMCWCVGRVPFSQASLFTCSGQVVAVIGKCSNWPLPVGTVQGVGGCSKEMRTVKPQPTLLTFQRVTANGRKDSSASTCDCYQTYSRLCDQNFSLFV